jgi:ATP-dependent helicase/nuclease subunit B
MDAHLAAAEALAGADALWQGDDGEAAARILRESLAEEATIPNRPPQDYPDFIAALLEASVIRPAYGRHPRLFIWGPLEARLQKADTVILGGLNEGVWPAEPAADPWMSRGMMEKAGLPPPEQRLGLAAHDFVQTAGSAGTVYLTRALKVDGAPAVASRWLVRLETLLGGLDLGVAPKERWLAYARGLDKAEKLPSIAPPRPTPPRAARPRSLSVSEIERWVRDPYAIYARRILDLKPLDPLEAEPDAPLRGQIIHKIAEIFADPGFDPMGPEALAQLLTRGRTLFDGHRIGADTLAFWWPRFVESAQFLLAEERKHRAAGERILAAEIDGAMEFPAAGGAFTLQGRADRIDRGPDGALIITDYKTGQAPTRDQMEAGLAPQLPLEAMMARAGCFAGIEAAPVSLLRVTRLMSSAKPRPDIGDVEALAQFVEEELRQLIARYDDPAYPYRSRPVPQFLRHEGPYDHLARVKEWSAGDNGEEAP